MESWGILGDLKNLYGIRSRKEKHKNQKSNNNLMKKLELSIGNFIFVLFYNLKSKLWMADLRSNKKPYPWLPFWFHFLPVLIIIYSALATL